MLILVVGNCWAAKRRLQKIAVVHLGIPKTECIMKTPDPQCFPGQNSPAELQALQFRFLGRFQELGQKAGLTEFASVEKVDRREKFLRS